MNETNHCPRCGAEIVPDAPQGLCPKCLMANVLGSDGPSKSEASTIDQDPNATVPSEVYVGSLIGDIPAAPEPVGKYSILGEHGKGGMGRVLLVHDEHLGRDIALKELLPDLGDGSTPTPARHSKEMAARFLREAKITGQLEHPSITPVHEIGRKADGTLYYTMKLVRGRTLSQAIKSAKNFEERLKLLPHFVDLCNAIAYAHSRGVIHRDIKPSNVMIGDYGETVIIDWGLAKTKSEIKPAGDPSTPGQKTIMGVRAKTKLDDDSGKTQHGQTMGTPAYMPPEQAAGDLDNIDERSDIYSLGAVLFEILTGQSPVEGNSVAEILRNVIAGKIRKVRSVERKCPKNLAAIVERAISLELKGRYTTAIELGAAVMSWKPRGKRSTPVLVAEIALLAALIVVPLAIILLNRITGSAVQNKLSVLSSEGIVIETSDVIARRNPTSSTDARLAEVQVSPQDRLLSLESANALMRPGIPHPLIDTLNALYSQSNDFAITVPEGQRASMLVSLRNELDREQFLLDELKSIARMPPATTGQVRRAAGLESLFIWRHQKPAIYGPPVEILFADAYFSLEQGKQTEFLDAMATSVALYQHIQDLPLGVELEHVYQAASRMMALIKTFYHRGLISPSTALTALSTIEPLFNPESLSLTGRIDRQDILWAYYHLDDGDISAVLWEFSIVPESFLERAAVALQGSPAFAFVRNMDMLKILDTNRAMSMLEATSYAEYDQELRSKRDEFPKSPYLKPLGYFFSERYLTGDLPFAYWVGKSGLERIQSIMTIELFKLEQGHYPDSLTNLVPDYLESVPTDLDGRPYIYRVEEKSFSLTHQKSEFQGRKFYWFFNGDWDVVVENN